MKSHPHRRDIDCSSCACEACVRPRMFGPPTFTHSQEQTNSFANHRSTRVSLALRRKLLIENPYEGPRVKASFKSQ